MNSKASRGSEFYESFQSARGKKGTVSIAERFDFIKEQVGTGKKVLELGCRFGAILNLVKEGNEIHGADFDRNALKVCAEKLGIEPVYANLNEDLPFGDQSFDVVILSEVLEHLPYPSITLSEIRRLLRPGGKLVGSVPNGVRLRNRFRFLLEGRVENDPTHVQHYGVASLTAELEPFFTDIQVKPIASRFLALSPKSFANYLLFCGIRKA